MHNDSAQQLRSRSSSRRLGHAAVVFVGLALLSLIPEAAHAGCNFDSGNTQGTYLVSVPAIVVNDPNVAVGDVLYTSTATGISHRVNFSCNGSGNGWGLVSSTGGGLPSGSSVFPTGVAGVGYRISQKGSYIYAYPYFSLDSSNSWYEDDAVTVELVKTGSIADGSSVQGPLSGFKAGTAGTNIIDAVINLPSQVVFTAPACRVNTTSIDVRLPTVTRNAFTGVDSVAGTTPFQIGMTCSQGATVYLTLDTATPVAGKAGVITPTSGGTNGIGVRVLDSSGTTAVAFGVKKKIGTSPNGALLVNYFAQYYQTKTAIATGLLGATATFTLSYQ